MSTAREFLAAVQQRTDAATDGPWQSSDRGGGTYEVHREPQWHDDDGWIAWTGRAGHDQEDAEFIAASRTDVPRLVAALIAVLDLHRAEVSCGNPRHTNFDVGCPECLVVCDSCGEIYPCPTFSVITDALTPKENDS